MLSHRVTQPSRILVVGLYYFKTPPVNPANIPHFLNNSNTGYQPVNEHKAPSSANLNQYCSSNRPLSARKMSELLMHSRTNHRFGWKFAQFDGNPLNWHEWFGQFKCTVDCAVLTDDAKLT